MRCVWWVWWVWRAFPMKAVFRALRTTSKSQLDIRPETSKSLDFRKYEAKPITAPAVTSVLNWDDGDFAKINYIALGKRLAESGDLFRNASHGSGLILVLSDGKHKAITNSSDLLPVIVDRVHVLMKDGK